MDLPEEIDSEFPWEKDHGIFELNENSLCFTCFYLDPYNKDNDIIGKIYKELIEYEFKTWMDNYVWSNTLPRIEIYEKYGYKYILGYIEFGENIDDEWLILSLLNNFSSRYQDLYIHIFDNEGEFLLIEMADSIPEFLDTNNGLNRAWLNSGRMVIIPNEYYPDKNLSLEESLKFLENCSFKLLKEPKINLEFHTKLSEYPLKLLQHIFTVELEVPEETAKIICNNNRSLGCLSIQESIGKEISVVENQQTVRLQVPVTLLCYLNLMTTDILNDAYKVGAHIENGIKNLQELGHTFDKGEVDAEMIEEFNKDHLQLELKRLQKIDNFIESKFEFATGVEDTKEQDEEELINKFKTIFQDSSNFDGISKEADINDYNDDTDYSSDSENEKLKKYFANEKIDIDEDDFFEFFCKEALKLKDDDIEKFRGLAKEEANEYNDESDYHTSDAEAEDIDPEMIENLMKTFKMEQGSGPMNTLLNSFK